MEKVWLKSYQQGVATNLDYPVKSLARIFDECVENYPNNVAIIFQGIHLTYRYMGDMVNRFAAALYDLGVRKGDRVGLMSANCPQWEIAYFAILKTGAIVVQTNPMYMEREVEYQMNDAGAEVIVVMDALYPRVAAIQARTALNRIITISMTENCTEYPDVYRFEDLVKKYKENPPLVEIDPQADLAVLQYTGGTTGVSKGVMLTHYNLVANALMTRAWFNQCEDGKERVLTVLPLFHVYAMTNCLNFSIVSGATQILLPRFDLDQVLQAINDYAPTIFPGSPTMYVAINNHPQVKEYNISSIKSCISGSAPLPVEVAQRFEQLTGGRLVEGYGLSEASPVTHCNPMDGRARAGSIGLSFPDTLTKIMDSDTGTRELPTSEVGELVIKGPQVMLGYWNRPQVTASTLRDGWLYTGDIAKMDKDGFVYIVDRKKDMIIAGGFNIYPREVEEVLYEHPAVFEAAVIGVPDLYRGETVKAYVVLRPGAKATQEEIITFCRKKISAFKAPRLVEFKEALPKTAVGKILRRQLVAEEKEGQAEKPLGGDVG
jgi:long-chain acyl-CoA synthetase